MRGDRSNPTRQNLTKSIVHRSFSELSRFDQGQWRPFEGTSSILKYRRIYQVRTFAGNLIPFALVRQGINRVSPRPNPTRQAQDRKRHRKAMQPAYLPPVQPVWVFSAHTPRPLPHAIPRREALREQRCPSRHSPRTSPAKTLGASMVWSCSGISDGDARSIHVRTLPPSNAEGRDPGSQEVHGHRGHNADPRRASASARQFPVWWNCGVRPA